MSITRKPTKLPKRVAGVRPSRMLRTGGGKLVGVMSNPLIAALATSVLIAGAAAIKNSKAVRAAAVKVRGKARRAGHNLSERTGRLSRAIGAGEGG